MALFPFGPAPLLFQASPFIENMQTYNPVYYRRSKRRSHTRAAGPGQWMQRIALKDGHGQPTGRFRFIAHSTAKR